MSQRSPSPRGDQAATPPPPTVAVADWATTSSSTAGSVAAPRPSLVEARRDAWRAENIGKSSPHEGSSHLGLGELAIGDLGDLGHQGGSSSDLRRDRDDFSIVGEAWPSIERGIRHGKGAPR